MRAFLLAIVTAAWIAAGAASDAASDHAPVAAPTPESVTFAVLRRDGVIVPFASDDNGRWTSKWPEPGRRLDIPISLESTPKSWWLRNTPVAVWTAWPVQGDSRPIRVRNPVNLTVQCERHVGLQTDYASAGPPVPRDMQPHPKDGLATAGDVAVERVEVLASAAPDWARVLEAIKEPFAAAEAKAGRAQDAALRDKLQRGQFPLELEVLYRSPGPRPGTQALYFEAVRRYGRPVSGFLATLGPDRTPLTYGAGWLLTDASGAVKLLGSLTVVVTDNERENLLYLLPLGTFRLGDRRYWAVQRAGWGFERYEILELAEPDIKVTFERTGGACR